jgi:uncharacterized membrane protein
LIVRSEGANRSGVKRPAPNHAQAIVGGLLLLGLLSLVPDLGPGPLPGATVRLEHARITEIGPVDPELGTGSARVVVLEGPDAGGLRTADLEPGPNNLTVPFQVGDEVVLQVSTTPDGEHAAVTDHWRGPLLLALLLAFAAIVVLVGGIRGVRALLALGLTVGVVVKIVLPLLLAGWPAIPVAIGAGSAVTIATLLLTEGPGKSTLAAAIGTLSALVLTAVLAAVARSAAQFGLLQGGDEIGYLQSVVGPGIDLGGLFLAAVILGALGVLDDVTITQAATVAELAESDPEATRGMLVRRGMNVGRSHIAATINTLVLAYVAASLPLLLLFAVGRQSPVILASTELVAIEIVRTLVGSIGIVAAVPLTTAVAAWLMRPAGTARL